MTMKKFPFATFVSHSLFAIPKVLPPHAEAGMEHIQRMSFCLLFIMLAMSVSETIAGVFMPYCFAANEKNNDIRAFFFYKVQN